MQTTIQTQTTSPSLDARGSLLLVTTAHPSLLTHQFDGQTHPNLGRLIQPRHTSSIEKTAAAGIPWAADNDCFQGLDAVAYVRMLDRIQGLDGCLWVTVPDVVGDVEQTLGLFDQWIGELESRGLPAALVAQDGLEHELDRVQWDRIAAVFIGGSTEWKESQAALAVATAAREHGKLVHWGRVNTRRRFDLIVAGGIADSFDGSKWARFRKTYLDTGLAWMRETRRTGESAMPDWRFTVDTDATDHTDAAIVADVLEGAVRDERNNPHEPVEVRHRPLAGPDVDAIQQVQIARIAYNAADVELAAAICAARRDGSSLRTIADAAELSVETVRQITIAGERPYPDGPLASRKAPRMLESE